MKIKVLLVDDERKFAMMLAKRLALREIDVEFVFTGQDALKKIETNRYDVTILDVKMPGLAGIELKQKMERLVPGMKIIFLTGHGAQPEIANGTAERALYLGKPLQIEILIQVLHQITGK